MKNKIKHAFTLAEVLIVISIIGIVAALTIPALVHNYEKAQTETQLKKSYALITQFFKQYMASEGCNDLMCTGLFDTTISNAEWQDNMDATARKYLKVIKSCKNGDTSCQETLKYLKTTGTSIRFNASVRPVFILTDGSLFEIGNGGCAATTNASLSKYKNICSSVCVDINGPKAPNTYGKDVFQFGGVAQNGDLYPDTSSEWSIATYGDAAIRNWKASVWNGGQCGENGKTIIESSSLSIGGSNCIARIIENGWKIDYY